MLTFADSLAATKQQDTTEEIRAKKKQEQQSPTTPHILPLIFFNVFIATSIRCLTKSLNT